MLARDGATRMEHTSLAVPMAPSWAVGAAARGELSPAELTFSPILDAGGLAQYEIVVPVHARNDGESLIGYVVETRAVRGRGVGTIRRLMGSSTLLIGQPGAGSWSDLERIVDGPPPIAQLDEVLIFDDSPRGPGVGVAQAVRGTPWVVWLQLSRQQVLAPIGTFMRRSAPVALAVALLGVVLAWGFSRRITQRITRLTSEVDAMERPDGDAAPAGSIAGTATAATADARGVRDGRDELDRLEQAFRGMTERAERQQRLEAQMVQSQKLEAVGRLAGGLAHDFNNVLTVVTNYGEMVAADLAPDSDSARDMEQILHAAERASRLTRQLLAFSRRQVLQPVNLDLNEVVRGSHQMLQRLLPSHVTIAQELDDTLAPVYADPGQIEQVLLNLALNASDAMPDGGRLSFQTSMAELDDLPTTSGEFPTTPVRHACLMVRDSGHGMDRETAAHAFDPFFTTKESGKGTGLGLASVHGIVTQLGGRIWLYSEPGKGTVFKIFLPVSDGPAERVGARTSSQPTRRGEGTILLVEDDPGTRQVTRRILVAHGFEVVEAGQGVDALDRLGRGDLTPHLVLSDVMMPGMNGVQLGERIAERWPQLPVVLMSGYADAEVHPDPSAEMRRPLVEKPFTSAALLDVVWRELDRA
jgi:signal transduction histidine kinase